MFEDDIKDVLLVITFIACVF